MVDRLLFYLLNVMTRYYIIFFVLYLHYIILCILYVFLYIIFHKYFCILHAPLHLPIFHKFADIRSLTLEDVNQHLPALRPHANDEICK